MKERERRRRTGEKMRRGGYGKRKRRRLEE